MDNHLNTKPIVLRKVFGTDINPFSGPRAASKLEEEQEGSNLKLKISIEIFFIMLRSSTNVNVFGYNYLLSAYADDTHHHHFSTSVEATDFTKLFQTSRSSIATFRSSGLMPVSRQMTSGK